MDQHPFDEEAIFKIASKIETAEARDAYLEQVCNEDESLLERISALLAIHDRRDNFLEEPAAE